MSVNDFQSGEVHASLEHDGSNVLCSIVKLCVGSDKIKMWEEWMTENEATFVSKAARSEYELQWTGLHGEFEALVNHQLEEAVTSLGVDMDIFESLIKQGVEEDDDVDNPDSLFKQITVFVNFIDTVSMMKRVSRNKPGGGSLQFGLVV